MTGAPDFSGVTSIIFDLDDTLYDASALVGQAHREAAEAMVRAGLPATVEEALARRLALFAAQPRENVNRLLAAAYGVTDEAVAAAGFEAFHSRPVPPIRPFDGVPEMLERLRGRFGLFLVTSGSPETQREKIGRLGLDACFHELLCVDPRKKETKLAAFATLVELFGGNPEDYLVVGDRIDREIRCANTLGMHSVRVKGGEYSGLEPASHWEVPEATLGSVVELEAVLGG